jgi:hypothetical protein
VIEALYGAISKFVNMLLVHYVEPNGNSTAKMVDVEQDCEDQEKDGRYVPSLKKAKKNRGGR